MTIYLIFTHKTNLIQDKHHFVLLFQREVGSIDTIGFKQIVIQNTLIEGGLLVCPLPLVFTTCVPVG